MQKAEQIAASSVPLSGSSSGTDEASLSWSKYCIGESVQGIDLDDGLLMPKLSYINDVVTQRQGLKKRIFSKVARQKKRKKGGAR